MNAPTSRLRWLLPALLISLLSACITSAFLPKEITMSAVELTTRMERRFPVDRTAGGLVDLTFSKPVVTFATPRLATQLSVRARLLLSSSVTEGTLTLSGVPYYDAATRGLYLRDARVDKIELGRVPETYSQALAKVASQLVKTQFEGKPFYTFREEDFTKFGIGYEPLALAVRNDALVLTLRR